MLFDEVDKAHPDVLTVLLQLFDEVGSTNYTEALVGVGSIDRLFPLLR